MSASRIPFIAGNWKMHKTAAEAREFLAAMGGRSFEGVEVAVCTPFTALWAACEAAPDGVGVYAQTMHEAPSGAFTGEVSAPMLTEVGVRGVVLGHSERRQYFNETDKALQRKVPAALEAGLTPILCVGETEEERERGDTQRKLRTQVQEGLHDVPTERLHEVVIAYELIWAIGTGKTATPEMAQEACAFCRALVRPVSRGGRFDPGAVRRVDEARQRGGVPRSARRRRRAHRWGLAGAGRLPGDRRRRFFVKTFPSAALIILDGWGLAPPGPGNAVDLASTPVFDDLWSSYPRTQLIACGEAVGLPEGQMGNSEVGHLNLGAGAVVKQDLVRINEADFGSNSVLVSAMEGTPRLHLIGLVSDGGVHSSLDHLERLVSLARSSGVADVVVHAFTDGRDTSPHGGADFVARVESWEGVRVGTVIGRYFGMDRDKREERTEKARALLVSGEAAHHFASGEEAVRAAYERDETDEFIDATTVGDEALIRDGDSVVMFNFRPDRMRQIVTALGDFRDHDADGVRGGLAVPGGVPAGAAVGDDRARDRRARGAAAARRRDREVPARDVLLQRGRGGGVRGGGPAARAVPPRRADLRPQARDERARGGRCLRGGLAGGLPAVRDHQLREPGHGRSHGLDPGGRGGVRGRRCVPRRRGLGGVGERRRMCRHRRPWER